MAVSKEPLQIDQLSLEAVNSIFSRIRERLDKLEGLRGTVTINDTVNSTNGIKSTDAKGTVIHSLGI